MVSRAMIEQWGARGKKQTRMLDDDLAIARQIDLFDLYVDRHDASLGKCLIEDGFWEAWITSWMLRNIAEDYVCIDVGANMGYYTMLMAYMATQTGSVYAFEPQPKFASLLKRSVALNNYPQVQVFETALSNEKGVANLAIPGDMYGSASIHEQNFDPKWGTQTNFEVQTDTMDNFFGGMIIDFIKIDAEGAEPLIWAGMQKVLDNNPGIVVAMEWDANNWTPEECSKFIDDIEERMDINRINFDGYEETVTRSELETSDGNWQMLALRHKEE